jgi:hypothetical protein
MGKYAPNVSDAVTLNLAIEAFREQPAMQKASREHLK